MPSPFIDRPEDIVPRTLRDLLAAAPPPTANRKRPRRQRRTLTTRGVT